MPVITKQMGEHVWYAVMVHYPTAYMAKKAWERADKKLIADSDGMGLGLTRLGPNTDPSDIAAGSPEGVYPVVAVTLDQKMANRAVRALSDGTPFEPTDGFLQALILRRAKFVLEHAGEGPGRYSIRRPENRGAKLDDEGNIIEPEPGQG